tara:strand:+ start:1723 stop:1881 length:159 start_codon:yes stop_codon:yes gene_type:complete
VVWAKEEEGRDVMAKMAIKRVQTFRFFMSVQGMKLMLIEKSIFAKLTGILCG